MRIKWLLLIFVLLLTKPDLSAARHNAGGCFSGEDVHAVPAGVLPVSGDAIRVSPEREDVCRGIRSTPGAADFTTVPVIADIDTLLVLDDGGVLDLLPPAITDDGGFTILTRGWELGGNAITMPYTVTFADNGKTLRYWAANTAGRGVSNEVTVTVHRVVTFLSSLRTPAPVCAGTTLRGAGLEDPATAPGVTLRYYFLASGSDPDTELTDGLDYILNYGDDDKLLICRLYTEGVLTAESPAVRVAVMKEPEIHLTALAAFSVEDGERLCLPSPRVVSNGSEVTLQGWKWSGADGVAHDFTNCDKADRATMDGARICYVAQNSCSSLIEKEYITLLNVSETVGEFIQTADEICDGVLLRDVITFNAGGRPGTYSIDGVEVPDFTTRTLTVADNLKILKYSYNGGKSERRLTLVVHPIPSMSSDFTASVDTVCRGTAQTLDVTAAGDNRLYRWQRKNGAVFSDMTGETESRLWLPVDADITVRCLMTATCVEKSAGVVPVDGTPFLVSAEKKIILSQAPGLELTGVTSPVKHCEGTPVQLPAADRLTLTENNAAVAAGDRWWTLGGQKVESGDPVKTADNGKLLGYRARNSCGETVVVFPVTIQVDEKPVFVQDPLDAEVQMGSQVRLAVRAAGSGKLTWRWQKKGAGSFADIPGSHSNTLSFISSPITDITLPFTDSTYRCIVTTDNTCASSATSAEAKVRVLRTRSNISIVRQPVSYEQCEGAGFNPLTVEITGTGHFQYIWYKTDAGGDVEVRNNTGAASTDSYTVSEAGTYYCVVTGTDDATGIRSQPAVVTVYAGPAGVNVLPEESRVCEGGTVTLGVSATGGDGLTYQWYKRKIHNMAGDTLLCAGATSTTFTPLELSAGVVNDYYCIVSGKYCPGLSVRSPIAEIMVNQPPVITAQPASLTVCGSAAETLRVTAATDSATGYAWYRNGAQLTGNTDTLSVTEAGVYTCEVSSARCGSVMSAPALITVSGVPEAKLGGAASVSACKGEMITLPAPVMEANGSVIVAEKTGWYDGAVLVGTLPVAADKIYQYQITYKCSASAATSTSFTAGLPAFTVTMDTVPVITKNPVDRAGCGSSSFSKLSVTATGTAALTYQWYKDGVKKGTTNEYASPAAGVYHCVVSNRCGSVASSTATLTQYAALAVTASAAISVCPGEIATIGVTVTAGVPVSYAWTKDGAAVAGAAAPALTVSDAGTYVCTVTDVCGTEVKASIRVTLKAPLRITTHPAGGAVCDATKKLTVTAEGATAYQWRMDGAVISGEVAAAYTVPKTTAGLHSYQCEVRGSCDTIFSAAAMVEGMKMPLVSLPVTEIKACVGDVITLPAVSVEANGSLIDPVKTGWFVSFDPNNKLLNSWTVTGTTALYFCYQVTYTCAGSEAVAFSSTLTVTPVAVPVITKQPVDQVVCGEDPFAALSLTAAGGSTLGFQWYKDGTAETTDSVFIPADPGLWHCVVSSVCGSVTSSAVTLSRHDLLDVAGTPAAVSICPGTSVTLGLTVTAGEPASYAWTKDGLPVAGAASPTLTAGAGGKYVCTVTDVFGNSKVASASVVTLKKSTRITTQPVGGAACNATKRLTLDAVGEGTLAWQWRKDGALIAGGTNATYDVPAADLGTHSYQCEVRGACDTVFSAAAVVVIAKPPVVNLPLTEIKACVGDVVTLPVVAVEANGSVIDPDRSGWYNSLDPKNSLVNSWVSADTKEAWPRFCYKVTYTCGGGSAEAVSSQTLIVKPIVGPSIGSGPVDQTVCGTASFSELILKNVEASYVDSLTYQWYKDGKTETDSVRSWYLPKAEGVYYAVMSNRCGSVMSAPATVRRYPAIEGLAIAGADSICPGTYTTLSAVTTSGTPQSYVWKSGTHVFPVADLSTFMVDSAADYTCTVTDRCGGTHSADKSLKNKNFQKAEITERKPFSNPMTIAQSFGVTPPGGKWYINTVEVPSDYLLYPEQRNALITYKAEHECGNSEFTTRLKMTGEKNATEMTVRGMAEKNTYFAYDYPGCDTSLLCVKFYKEGEAYILASPDCLYENVYRNRSWQEPYKLYDNWDFSLFQPKPYVENGTEWKCDDLPTAFNRYEIMNYMNGLDIWTQNFGKYILFSEGERRIYLFAGHLSSSCINDYYVYEALDYNSLPPRYHRSVLYKSSVGMPLENRAKAILDFNKQTRVFMLLKVD